HQVPEVRAGKPPPVPLAGDHVNRPDPGAHGAPVLPAPEAVDSAAPVPPGWATLPFGGPSTRGSRLPPGRGPRFPPGGGPRFPPGRGPRFPRGRVGSSGEALDQGGVGAVALQLG